MRMCPWPAVSPLRVAELAVTRWPRPVETEGGTAPVVKLHSAPVAEPCTPPSAAAL